MLIKQALKTSLLIGSSLIFVVACSGTPKNPGQANSCENGLSQAYKELDLAKTEGFDKIVFVPTSPAAAGACQKVIDSTERKNSPPIEQLTWFDIS